MLQATIVPGNELSTRGLAGSASVEQLQVALVGLAQATGNQKINPGAATGTVNDATISAVANAIAVIKKWAPGKVPSFVWTALGNINLILTATSWLGVAGVKSTIINGITSYASYLTMGVKAATVALAQSGGGGGSTAKTYRAGSVQAYDPATKQWIVASPKLTGNLGGLGVSPEGTQFEITDKLGNKVALVVVSLDQLKKWCDPPWYKSVWFWGSVASVTVVSIGGYMVIKKWRAR